MDPELVAPGVVGAFAAFVAYSAFVSGSVLAAVGALCVALGAAGGVAVQRLDVENARALALGSAALGVGGVAVYAAAVLA